MRLYIAGPVSSDPTRTIEEKAAAFGLASVALEGLGYETLPATSITPECGLDPDECQSQSGHPTRQGQGKHSWECYMKYDLRGMLLCDGVALLKGWLISPGARIEVNTAIAVGLPCQTVGEWGHLA